MGDVADGFGGFFAIIFFIILVIYIIKCCNAHKAKARQESGRYGAFSDGERSPQATIPPDHEPGMSSPIVVPPYPVEPRHPTPQAAPPPGPGFTAHNPPYPTYTPHPMPGVGPSYPPSGAPLPYPPAGGAVPYPMGGAAPYPDYSAQPPSYSEAVAQPAVPPNITKEGYAKQAPYNPNY